MDVQIPRKILTFVGTRLFHYCDWYILGQDKTRMVTTFLTNSSEFPHTIPALSPELL